MSSKKLIIVTGFGPFKGHENVNPSWEAVKLLPNCLDYNNVKYEIRKIEVPVVYDEVNKLHPTFWDENPALVIHCGVNGEAKKIHIERNAHNKCFLKEDYSGCFHPTGAGNLRNNQTETCELLSTGLDTTRMVKELNTTEPIYLESDNAGNYLCCYIYLHSLDIDPKRSLFIHVPSLSDFYTPTKLSSAVMQIMQKCLDQSPDNN